MKGLMSLLLQDAPGYDLLMLGGQRQRYRLNGFERGGAGVLLEVNAANVRHDLDKIQTQGLTLRQVQESDTRLLEEIHHFHQRRFFSADRPREELFTILSSWHQTLWALTDSREELLGYFAMMKDRITECYFPEPRFLPAALKLLVKPDRPVEFLLSPVEKENLEILAGFGEGWELQDTQMVRVSHWQRVVETLLSLKLSREPLLPGRVVLSLEGTTLAVQVQGNAVTVEETEEEPQRILTRPQAEQLLFSVLSPALEPSPLLKSWFPLPLFLPAGDCF